jgi:hypothetical protein
VTVQGHFPEPLATNNPIGQLFYIPYHYLATDELTGGVQLFNASALKDCYVESRPAELNTQMSYYLNTESVYKSLTTETGLSGDMTTSFTLGASLDALTQNIDGSRRKVSGMTVKIYAYEQKIAFDRSCMIAEDILDRSVAAAFEKLPEVVNNPEQLSSWSQYATFLTAHGSHFVSDVRYGSSIFQNVFSQYSFQYSYRKLAVKACVALAGVSSGTAIENLGVSVCTNITTEEAQQSSSTATSSTLVVKGGTRETRAELYRNRSAELITKFLSESNETQMPVLYGLIPIWTPLQYHYLGSPHYAKAKNLEAYYKGYLNFDCRYKVDGKVALQRFERIPNNASTVPSYRCVIPDDGCHTDDDCHYKVGPKCSCHGDTTVKYTIRDLLNGKTKQSAAVFRDGGWYWQGCYLDSKTFWTKCRCDKHNKFKWHTIWPDSTTVDDYFDLNFKFMPARMRRNISKRQQEESEPQAYKSEL